MKKLSLLLIAVVISWSVSAQIVGVMEDYRRKQAAAVEKARVQAMLASVPQNYIIAYAKRGIVHYLLQDGKRTNFLVPPPLFSDYVYNSSGVMRFVSKSEEDDRLATLIDTLSAQGWSMSVTLGGEYEVYIFNRGRNQIEKSK